MLGLLRKLALLVELLDDRLQLIWIQFNFEVDQLVRLVCVVHVVEVL